MKRFDIAWWPVVVVKQITLSAGRMSAVWRPTERHFRPGYNGSGTTVIHHAVMLHSRPPSARLASLYQHSPQQKKIVRRQRRRNYVCDALVSVGFKGQHDDEDFNTT
jgi:hypothetical protein